MTGQTTPAYYTIGEITALVRERHPHVTPGQLSQAFYRRAIGGDRCPRVGKDRRIPPDIVPSILAYYDRLHQRTRRAHADA